MNNYRVHNSNHYAAKSTHRRFIQPTITTNIIGLYFHNIIYSVLKVMVGKEYTGSKSGGGKSTTKNKYKDKSKSRYHSIVGKHKGFLLVAMEGGPVIKYKDIDNYLNRYGRFRSSW